MHNTIAWWFTKGSGICTATGRRGITILVGPSWLFHLSQTDCRVQGMVI